MLIKGAASASDIPAMVTAIAPMRTAKSRQAATGEERIRSRSARP
jgi:hypothetical protein